MWLILKNQKSNKKKIIVGAIIILIIVILTAIATLYDRNDRVRRFFDKYVFMKNVYQEKLPTIITDAKYVFAYKDKIFTFKDNELKAYNQYGKEQYSLNIELTNPIFESNDSYICLAEKNGQKVYVISGRNIVWQQDVKGNIAKVAINKNGMVAVAILGTEDKSVVAVFDKNGEEIFSRHIAEDYVIDIALSEDSQFLAIAKVNYSGIDVKSVIETLTIKDAKQGNSVINEYKSDLGELIIQIKYNQKNNLICMYDKSITVIKDNYIESKVDFTKENLLFADLNNKIITVAKNDNNVLDGNIELRFLDTNSDNIVTYEVEEPKELLVFENMVALNLGADAIFINNNGWMVKEYHSMQEINEIILSNEIAGIVYKDKIVIISL